MADQDLKDQLTRVEDKLDEHTKILASVDKTLAVQALQLEQHIKRTDLAEENMKMLRQEVQPLQDRFKFMNKLARLFLICAGLTSSVYYALKILGKLP